MMQTDTGLAAPPPLPRSTPAPARVMIVDDSAVVRGLVARWLGERPGFEVVATAANGLDALAIVGRARPDILLLDLDMPKLDGLGALPRILEACPDVAVIVVSTLTRGNAQASLRCLELGAVDYLAKPQAQRHLSMAPSFRAELLSKLQAIAEARRTKRPGGFAFGHGTALQAEGPRPVAAAQRCLLVGASTGGPRAVATLLAGLGATLERVSTLIVQHMPPIFTTVFAEQIGTLTGLVAREPADGERLLPGRIYIAPGGRHMGLRHEKAHPVIRIDDGPPEHFCRPAVDVLFRDAASILGTSALAVVLTGMGSDGMRGAEALVGAGGTVLAQDAGTSTVWGMPGSIARAGLAKAVLPLDRLAPAITELLQEVGR